MVKTMAKKHICPYCQKTIQEDAERLFVRTSPNPWGGNFYHRSCFFIMLDEWHNIKEEGNGKVFTCGDPENEADNF
jgi:hypothetical protein